MAKLGKALFFGLVAVATAAGCEVLEEEPLPEDGSEDSGGGASCDTCEWANDGECDEPTNCPVGTDCTDCGEPDTSDSEMPDYVTVELLGVLVGLAKIGDYTWDGEVKVPPDALELVTTAMGAPGVGEALGVVQNYAAEGSNRPDPIGVAELDLGDGFEPSLTMTLAEWDSNIDNTYQAQWEGPPYPTWSPVPLAEGTRIRVTIEDEDWDIVWDQADRVGVATLTIDDLLDALHEGTSYWVKVGEQTNNQLLAVQIQVTAVDG